jgi:hypothetical protein
VAETGQPYAFTGDDPLNATDPLGLVTYGSGSDLTTIYIFLQEDLPSYVGKTIQPLATREYQHSRGPSPRFASETEDESIQVESSQASDVEEYLIRLFGTLGRTRPSNVIHARAAENYNEDDARNAIDSQVDPLTGHNAAWEKISNIAYSEGNPQAIALVRQSDESNGGLPMAAPPNGWSDPVDGFGSAEGLGDADL